MPTYKIKSVSKIFILGLGYTGAWVELILRTLGHDVSSSRRSGSNASFLDLSDPASWQFEDRFDYTFWLAPSPSLGLIKDFLQKKQAQLGKIICCSSTGFFLNPPELHGEINERSPLASSNPRVQAENFLCSEADAMIIHAAGIYGPARNPQRWLASGRIHPSEKLLNLIHVGDLALFLCQAMTNHQAESRWVLSDNQPYSWNYLYQAWAEELRLPKMCGGSSEGSKRVNPQKSFDFFNFRPQFKDVFEGLTLGLKEDSVRQTILRRIET